MKIIIKEREFDYVSDYPADWKYSAGDPYKFPVIIGGYPCFIKRFEKKTPEDISGWSLLQRLKGKNEPNLIRLHDIANTEENGKDIYYVFFEYLDGTTLDKLIPAKTKLNLNKLTEDLFSAFNSLRINGFWFVDFCEKNIFLDKSGKFLLVDLDSTYPVEETPDKDMYGSKDYWGLVLDFYKKVLNKNDVKLDQLDSTSFNYLQIPFLLLHIVDYYTGNEKEYTATSFFNKLPRLLDDIAPQIKEVFLTAFENGRKQPITDNDLLKLNDIIVNKILTYKPANEVIPIVDEKPVINLFKADKEQVANGEKITFSWEVTQADRVEIYKNKASLKQLPAGQTSVELTEFFDTDKKESSYTLMAYHKAKHVESEPVSIKLKTKKKSKAWLIAAVFIIVVGFVAYQFLNSGRGNIYVIDSMLVEDSVVTVHVKDLVDTSTVKIYVNGYEGKKISLINNDLVVRVPGIKDTTTQETLSIKLTVNDSNGTEIYTTPVNYIKHVTATVPITLYEGVKINIIGKNLNIAGLDVLFNNTHSTVTSQQFKRFSTIVPELDDTTTGQFVNIVVSNKGEAVLQKKYTIKHSIIHLTSIAANATWTGGFMATDSSITSPQSLIFQNISNQTIGFVTASQQKMEDGNIYNNVLRTHPHWLTQGTIQGLFPPVTRKNIRFFKAKIGFLNDGGVKDNRSFDGAKFRIRIHYDVNGAEQILRLYNSLERYDGRLTDINVKIPAQVPAQFSVELAVDAGVTSNSDWAAWVDPRIDTKYFSSPFKIAKIIKPL